MLRCTQRSLFDMDMQNNGLRWSAHFASHVRNTCSSGVSNASGCEVFAAIVTVNCLIRILFDGLPVFLI